MQIALNDYDLSCIRPKSTCDTLHSEQDWEQEGPKNDSNGDLRAYGNLKDEFHEEIHAVLWREYCFTL